MKKMPVNHVIPLVVLVKVQVLPNVLIVVLLLPVFTYIITLASLHVQPEPTMKLKNVPHVVKLVALVLLIPHVLLVAIQLIYMKILVLIHVQKDIIKMKLL